MTRPETSAAAPAGGPTTGGAALVAALRHRLFGDLFEADEFRALELEHDLVQGRAARERRHRLVGAVLRELIEAVLVLRGKVRFGGVRLGEL